MISFIFKLNLLLQYVQMDAQPSTNIRPSTLNNNLIVWLRNTVAR